jgi:23S rRNA pseudouridine2605 synthase
MVVFRRRGVAEERIQKILAKAGLCARRKAETLISEGRVTVNGRVVDGLGTKADAEQDEIAVDGRVVHAQKLCVVMFNKPAGCVTTASDAQGRPTVLDFFSDFPVRLFAVGRLDMDTEGLLLLTNDGAYAHNVLHPSRKVYKTYEALVEGVPDDAALDLLRVGVMLDDGPTAPARVRLIERRRDKVPSKRRRRKDEQLIETATIEISICEGRKRQVRRMCRAAGHNVVRLKRVSIGALALGGLQAGKWRELPMEEAELAFLDS